MADAGRIQKQPQKKKNKSAEEATHPVSSGLSQESKQKLKELDEFIEGVLQDAGEEFLDEFKQVEGE